MCTKSLAYRLNTWQLLSKKERGKKGKRTLETIQHVSWNWQNAKNDSYLMLLYVNGWKSF